jgi:hypothetical protein
MLNIELDYLHLSIHLSTVGTVKMYFIFLPRVGELCVIYVSTANEFVA